MIEMTREEAIERLKDIKDEYEYFADDKEALIIAIEAIKQIHIARWKRFHIYMYGTFYECDKCGFEAPDKYNYCPNCGATMEGVYREQ